MLNLAPAMGIVMTLMGFRYANVMLDMHHPILVCVTSVMLPVATLECIHLAPPVLPRLVRTLSSFPAVFLSLFLPSHTFLNPCALESLYLLNPSDNTAPRMFYLFLKL